LQKKRKGKEAEGQNRSRKKRANACSFDYKMFHNR